MKSLVFASALALSLLVFTPPRQAATHDSGPSASGSFQFSADGLAKRVEFEARTHKDGTTTGRMTFSGPAEVPDQDVDGEGGPATGGQLIDIFTKVEFDCLVVEGNRAVMSGVVSESTVGEHIGRRALLAVEDNGEGVGAAAPDRLTWGVYRSAERGWVPVDAERPDDNGALLEWLATDAERPDDAGVPSRKSEVIGCRSFPLSSYSFVDVKHGDGNIQVRP